MIWSGDKFALPDRLIDDPKRSACNVRRRRLNNHRPIIRKDCVHFIVKGSCVQFSQRVIGWIWKIDHNEVKNSLLRTNPDEGILINYFDLRRRQRMVIEFAEGFVVDEHFGYSWIKINQRNFFHTRVFQYSKPSPPPSTRTFFGLRICESPG
jgi:hypothetical protein